MGDRHVTNANGSRRGIAASEVVVVLVAAGIVGATGVYVLPKVVGAGTLQAKLAADAPPTDPAKAGVFESLRKLMVDSKEVLAMRPATDAGLTEIVLWHKDEGDDGKIDPSEVIVLTHSAFLGTITAHAATNPPKMSDENFARLVAPIDRVWATHPDFCAAWRRRPDVTGRVVAAEIDQMRIEPASPDGSRPGFYVRLTWSGSVSDESIPDAVFGVPLSAPLWSAD
ncbi:MAG: hypothetical protein KDA20_06215 [Phycisphaerales bacterium]|nr:hypothetical protein [Phycisphaerales bacterium]